jgi:predicted Fe-Mo cluster-binding NifX family protein
MKIAISTENGFVSAHFGRCPTYTIVDIQNGRVTARQEIQNPGHQPGFLPQYLSDKGVEAIIAGGMGPRAQGLFATKNIQTLIGVQGPVDEVIAKFLRGELEAGQDLCDHGHHHDGAYRHEESPGSPGIAAPVEGKICVTARGPDLEAEIDPSFGRAAYFLVVDPNTMEFRSFENPNAQAVHGAGIQSAQFVAGQGVAAVLTGEVGPNARQVLEAAGVRVISVAKSKAREAVAELARR